MLYFLKKKIKKNTSRYHYQNLDNMIYMIYSFWDIEQNILKLVILGHLLPLRKSSLTYTKKRARKLFLS